MRYFSIFLLTLFCVAAQAQLLTTPLNENIQVKKAAASFKVKRTGGPDTLDIPFLDDFSYNQVYPNASQWTDRAAYINTSIAIQPPTIGVATLDGVNQFGAPYSNSGQGSADTLTVMPLALGGKSAASNVQLSFYYQPRGYGDKPGVNDSLLVEFKTANDNWVTVWSYADTTSSVETPVFNFVTIPITSSAYFYDGFQFRFRNMATLTGLRDLWHIDYVRVTEGQNANETLNDVAFASPPRSIFKTYTALPWWHFEEFETEELARQNAIEIYNHFSTPQFVGPATFSVFDGNNNLIFGTNILNAATPPINGNIPTGFNPIDSVLFDTEYAIFRNQMALYDFTEEMTFELAITINPSNQQSTVAPILRNDTIYREIVFGDYFAYDDGSAEIAVAAGRIGDQFAIRYHANVDDTLKAIQINLPRMSGNITNQRINLKVWVGDLNTPPVYQRNFVRPVYVDSLDSWTTYSLDTNAVFIPGGSTFYVGWQQATTPPSISRSFLIGYDRNSTEGFKNIFQEVGGSWERLDTAAIQPEPGSIMIRPVLGEGTYFSTNTKKLEEKTVAVKIYPNPATDWLNVGLEDALLEDFDYQIFNPIGQLLQQGNLSSRIPIAQVPSGWFIFKIINTKTGQVNVSKVLKQ